jgi:hypothetical protein
MARLDYHASSTASLGRYNEPQLSDHNPRSATTWFGKQHPYALPRAVAYA